jgi:hypothetical protein
MLDMPNSRIISGCQKARTYVSVIAKKKISPSKYTLQSSNAFASVSFRDATVGSCCNLSTTSFFFRLRKPFRLVRLIVQIEKGNDSQHGAGNALHQKHPLPSPQSRETS